MPSAATLLRLIIPLGAGVLASTCAPATEFPQRPLRMIVTFPAGSQTDVIARVVAARLGDTLGQQVIVDNRVGASGALGSELAKNAPADGHTLMMASFATFALLPALKPRLAYDPERDFAALTRVASGAFVMAVQSAAGIGSVAELVKLARAQPGRLNYGSSGNGSIQHLAGAMFDLQAGVTTVHVPYKGAVLALADLIGGQLQYIVASPTIVQPHARAGRLRMLATTGARRDPLLPELPVLADTVPGFEITSWQGLVLPARTPPAVQSRLHAETVRLLQLAEVRELLAVQGVTALSETPAAFAAFIKAERARIARVARSVDIALD